MTTFSDSYEEARQKFIAAAESAGARLESLAVPSMGPSGEALTIDLAVMGELSSAKILIHSSGIHGVEGYAGSAVQIAALEEPLSLPDGTALVFVHILNPFGMAWSRRVNENNVDLNRNFLKEGEAYSGADANYLSLDPFLNHPGKLPLYWFYLLANLARYGFAALKKAVVQGQYNYPGGLFYGGSTLQDGPRLLKAWLKQNVTGAKEVVVVDVHTGLGRFGEEVLFCHGHKPSAGFGKRMTETDEPNGYVVRGGLESLTAEVFAEARWSHVTEEFGTYSMAKILRALRAENADFRENKKTGAPGLCLKNIMSPQDRAWRESAVKNGTDTLKRCLAWLGER